MRRARLNIHLQKQHLSEEVDRGAVARVIPLSRDAQNPAQEVVIPAGRGKKFATVNVKPGSYVVETRLPSGNVVRKKVDVEKNSDTKQVALEGAPSPKEWLSWQTLAAPSRTEAAAKPHKGRVKGRIKVSTFAVDRLRADSWTRLAALSRARTLPTLSAVRAALGAGAPRAQAASDRDKRVARYVWSKGAGDQQTIAVIERPGTLEIVAIPVPWRTSSYKLAEIECAVPSDSRQPISVAVRDPELAAVVGNLAAGALSDARTLWGERSPLEWLAAKRENQYAAALGACVLVKADTTGKRQQWDAWIENLAGWFDWLPDGAALQSVRALRLSRSAKDLPAVKKLVQETLRRGIPILAPVSAMFLDTLSTLVEHPTFDSDDLEEQFKAVRSVMLHMQSGQPFTLLRFERKGSRAL
jgi:hypothetical protein